MKKISRLIVAGLCFWFAAGLASAKELTPESIEGTTRVNAEQLVDLVESLPNLVMIDARKSSDYSKGHIEGAVSLPNTETDNTSLAKVIPSKDTPVLFYCNGEKCGRSVVSAKTALSAGYKEIYWFRGGMEEWVAKAMPVMK